MTPTQCAEIGERAIAIIDDFDHEEQTIFGRKATFAQDVRDRMIADTLRRLVAEYRTGKSS